MTVENTKPIQHFTANGSTKAFAINFAVEGKDNIKVTVNDTVVSVNDYTYNSLTNSVVFNTAPVNGVEVTIERETSLERSITYKTYDNSFRPETLNYDLDRIWHVLQEQDVLDAEILARLKDEIEWRRTHDLNYDELAQAREKQIFDTLKGYTDTLFVSTNQNIFQGVIAGIVFAQDGKSVQTHINELLAALEASRRELTDTTATLNQNLLSEINRAKNIEQQLSIKVENEASRAKAVEQSLQLQISTSNGGIKYFETVAALNAFVPTATDPTQAYVFATKKNYLWNGTVWLDEGISVLDQAKKYTDDSVQIFDRGVNIFDPTDYQVGKYYSYIYGVVSDAPNTFFASKLIRIEPNTEYQVPKYYNQQFCFYDENKVFISGVENVVSDEFKFTTPINARYIGMTGELTWLSTMMLCKSSEYPPVYVPFTVKNDNLQVKSKQISDLEANVKNILGVSTSNIIDTTKITPSCYVEFSTGRLITSTAYSVAGYYEIKPNTEYQTSANYVQQFAFYDADFKYISGMSDAYPTHKFITPTTAKYIRLTVNKNEISTLVVAESAVFPKGEEYVPFALQFKDLSVKSSQVLDLEKKIQETVSISDLNIIDPTKISEGLYVMYMNGGLGYNQDYVATDFIEVQADTEYQTSTFYNQQFAFYDETKKYISGLADVYATHKFVTPANAKYARFTIGKNQLNTIVIAKSADFPKYYTPYRVKIAKDLVIEGFDSKVTEIWVSADENDTTAKFKGKNAIQLALDSITDASAKNRYIIRVKKGLYKITQAKDFIGYPGYPAMILTKNHVDIYGQGEDNTIIWAELPYNDDDIGPSADGNVYDRSRYQTVYSYADDCLIKDMTFVAKNLRYTIHIDNPNGANKTRNFENVGFIFKGNKGSLQAMGCGTSEGEETYLVGGRSQSDTHFAFASHNNIQFSKPSVWSFKGHNFTSIDGKVAIFMQSDGSLLQDKLELIGSSFGGKAYILDYVEVWLTGNTGLNRDTFNHAEWQVTGYGNEPFLFDNRVEGLSLRFKTNTTGASSTIRFDKTSSAYPILIKNNQTNADTSLYIDSREYLDGYIIQDGTVGLAGQAWGCKDLSEKVYLYDGSTNYTSMAKRLGNCSTNTKTLVVVVNGASNTITFNKDYSSMTNVQILAEMNAQLSGATIELVSYGRDYYPTITDMAETVYNTGSTYIPKGSVVTKSGGVVKLANGNDKVYGVALDDIPVMTVTAEGVKKGQGRVLKKGYIYTNRSKAHYVLADNQSPSVGLRFNVSNGQLVTDANGRISVDIDSGVISINC